MIDSSQMDPPRLLPIGFGVFRVFGGFGVFGFFGGFFFFGGFKDLGGFGGLADFMDFRGLGFLEVSGGFGGCSQQLLREEEKKATTAFGNFSSTSSSDRADEVDWSSSLCGVRNEVSQPDHLCTRVRP